MRLAVFTNQFPTQLAPFFARDMRSLIQEDIELEVFPIHPLDPTLWPSVSDLLSDQILPRERVHHISVRASVGALRWTSLGRLPRFVHDAIVLGTAAGPYGIGAMAKTAYAAVKAWGWAQRFPRYDHVLAYWGSHAASCAYLFHRLTDPHVPFSMFVRANADLCHSPIRLAKKMLYADNVFLSCEFNRHYLRTKYDRIFPLVTNKMHVHYSGLDLDQVRFEPAGRPPHKVLAVGRFVELKGFRYLLHAVHALHQRGIAVQLELIGAGDQEATLRRLAEELGVGRHVTFRGWLLPDDVLRAMGQATVLVHPPIELDFMPNVIKEAMAVGTPVIASDLAGIPELLDAGRCGVLIPPGNIEALANAMETLLTNEPLRVQYARAARRHLEHKFDLRRNGKRLAERLRATERRVS
jgi:glycosyltransferase involved in cell wall biosynthesis